MVLFPDLQVRAQEELDSITGGQRLPTMDDSKSMPYLNALILDVLRWNCVAPTGLHIYAQGISVRQLRINIIAFPHLSISDDEYLGYHVPVGTLVYGNVW